jgi:hypothetical protein
MVQHGRLPANPEPGRKRRMRSKLERRQVVEETMRPGAPSVAVTDANHVGAYLGIPAKLNAYSGVNPNGIRDEPEHHRMVPCCDGTMNLREVAVYGLLCGAESRAYGFALPANSPPELRGLAARARQGYGLFATKTWFE